jgi:hypothetical protein
VQLDAVEAGGARVVGGRGVLPHHRLHLGRRQRARLVEGLQAGGVGEDLAGGADRARRHRLDARRLDVAAADAPGMHELQHDQPAVRVHRVGDAAPGSDLFRRRDAGLAAIGLADDARPSPLGDDQAGAGTLGVVRNHLVAGHAVGMGAVARHRRHHDAVAELEIAQPQGLHQSHQRTRIFGAGVPRRMVSRKRSRGAGAATSGNCSLSGRSAQNSCQLGNRSWKVP